MYDIDKIDFFMDLSLVDDPFPYFEALRARGPVVRLPFHNVVAITGYDEAIQVFNDNVHFSSINAGSGPFPPLPFKPEGDDITAQLAAHREQMSPGGGGVVTADGSAHHALRSLLMRLFTPSRLKQNEDNLWGIADELIDDFAESGHVELIRGFGVPFAGLVIADLLGVPVEDLEVFKNRGGGMPKVGEQPKEQRMNPLRFLDGAFTKYIEDRRKNPRGDVLSDLANAKFPDGSTPTVQQVVGVATILFGAGQDTTARTLGGAMQVIAERPDLQERMRKDRSLIADFVEEALRMEGAVKTSSRLVVKSTTIGGVDLPAGTVISIFNNAASRDPRRFETPQEIQFGRPKSREHLAFGRGPHTCPGSPLARTELRIGIDRLLARMSDIRINAEKHGPPGARQFHHEPIYILRGLQELHLTFTPIKSAPKAAKA